MKTFREFITECELVEGKVEWDNPKRPLQSGWTPREKNRARRIKTGVENPDKSSFQQGGPSERDYERHGSLTLANQEQSGVKTPKKGLHKFKDNKGQTQRKKYKSILSNLKEPKD